MDKLLDGVAFVTGAGSGIGQASAILLVKHGVRKLAIADLVQKGLDETAAKLKEVEGLEIETIQMDVSNEANVASAIQKVISRFGRLDYAVNNAGIAGPPVPTDQMEATRWQKTFDVNTTVRICINFAKDTS